MATLFHLVSEAEWAVCCDGAAYTPARFVQDGFVHCSPDPETTLAVARSYFSQAAGRILLLVIDSDRLSCPVRFEAPAPLPGGDGHRTPGTLFPHVYGPIPIKALKAMRELAREGGEFRWPLSG